MQWKNTSEKFVSQILRDCLSVIRVMRKILIILCDNFITRDGKVPL